MWDKLSFRLKITAIFSLSLTVLTISLTILTIVNSHQSITTPMLENIQQTTILQFPDRPLLSGDDALQFIDESEIREYDYEERILVIEDSGIHRFDDLERVLNLSNQNFKYQTFIIAGIVIFLGTVGAYLVSGVIVTPIKKLADLVENVEADRLKMTIPVPASQDEIASLTTNFNSMLNKLQRSFESKQLFAQNASHELKTPLTIIRANIEALAMEENPTNADYQEVFLEVQDSTERMIDLVEGLLAMGKTLEDDKKINIDVLSLFTEIFDNLQSDLIDKNLTYQINGNLTLKGDPLQIRQALLNLTSNAIRYNKQGGKITVALSTEQIIIEDTGIGIPKDALSQICDPFYCVDKSRSKKLGGNGLGLAITRNIIESHGMALDITSEVGIGTKITIEI